jgi:mobile intron protein|nr:MAG TPA: endonuclease [Caudoviricetes sp.]
MIIMQKKYQDKNWLQRKITELGNMTAIGRLCDVSGDTIEYWRKKFNIQRNIIHRRKTSLDENYFDLIDTEEKAYWLGFIMADGSMEEFSGNRYCYRLTMILKDSDNAHLVKMSKALSYDGEIKERTLEDKRGFTTYSSVLRITSKKMCSRLIELGIVSRKTGKEHIPKDIPESLVRHFIRGFFDGDGSITKSSNGKFYRFKLGSASEKIIIEIQKWLEDEIGTVNFYEDCHYRIPFYVLESNKKDTCDKIYHLLYDDAKIYLDRKYERVKEAINLPL